MLIATQLHRKYASFDRTAYANKATNMHKDTGLYQPFSYLNNTARPMLLPLHPLKNPQLIWFGGRVCKFDSSVSASWLALTSGYPAFWTTSCRCGHFVSFPTATDYIHTLLPQIDARPVAEYLVLPCHIVVLSLRFLPRPRWNTVATSVAGEHQALPPALPPLFDVGFLWCPQGNRVDWVRLADRTSQQRGNDDDPD